MKKSIFILAILNLLDGILTYFGMEKGIIEESNPILKKLEPEYILLIKVLLTCSILLIIKKLNKNKTILILSLIANFIYLIIMSMHLYWILNH